MTINLSKSFANNLQADLRQSVRESIGALCSAAIEISNICARGALEQGLGVETGAANSDGDAQKALDVRSDDIIQGRLLQSDIAYYASEERDDIITLDKDKALAVACDPLDGSSNIDTNISIGTIFSIYPKASTNNASFLRKANEQICAGFFVYGPATSLIITTGAGVEIYILDREDQVFKLAEANVKIAQSSKEYAINASNYHYWPQAIREFIEDCMLGQQGKLGEKYNMRWVGSLVADSGRILSRGGVFLYPADTRLGYENGRLRLLYECAPIAFIIEQAGGVATDGQDRILGIDINSLHQRVPFIFGSKNTVELIGTYYER